jgi:hypothetical protein
MKRFAFNLAASLSLVLCAAVVLLWVRSHWVADQIAVNTASYPCIGNDPELGPMFKDLITNVSVVSNYGTIEVEVKRSTRDDGSYLGTDNLKDWKEAFPQGRFMLYDHFESDPSGAHFPALNLHDSKVLFGRLGLFVGSYSIGGMMSGSVDFTGRVIDLPMWLLAAPVVFLPLLRLRRYWATNRRRQRLRQGLCPACRYNLTANISGVCPECGTPITAGVTA